MQPFHWHPPVALSAQEEQIVQRIRRAKLFVFLRHHRHELFDEAFQQELASLYRPSKRGHPPTAPAQLALAVILQAYTAVSDDEVIAATLMDRRWQVVLDCLDTEQAPFEPRNTCCFSQATHRCTDGSAVDRTDWSQLASHTQEFGSRALRSALDSSPLWGAGRVEDTCNLIGHALKKILSVVADQQGRDLVEVGHEAGADMVCGSSLKAARAPRLGSARAARRSTQSGLACVAGGRNLDANVATGRDGTGRTISGNRSSGKRARCADR